MFDTPSAREALRCRLLDPADQAKLFKLLGPEERIGVTLTSAYQLMPEASTSTLIVHHPQALYCMVRE